MPDGIGIATGNFKGYMGSNPRLYQHMGEGYPTGEYYLDHLTFEDIVALSNWMITLPEEYYQPIAGVHRLLEYHILHENDRHRF